MGSPRICRDRTPETWVIADEIHAPLTLAGATFTAWLDVSDAARERGFSVTSASKAFNLAALKCALVITASGRPRDALRRLGDLIQLDSNRSLLSERLAAELPKVGWTPPQASFIAAPARSSSPRSSGAWGSPPSAKRTKTAAVVTSSTRGVEPG